MGICPSRSPWVGLEATASGPPALLLQGEHMPARVTQVHDGHRVALIVRTPHLGVVHVPNVGLHGLISCGESALHRQAAQAFLHQLVAERLVLVSTHEGGHVTLELPIEDAGLNHELPVGVHPLRAREWLNVNQFLREETPVFPVDHHGRIVGGNHPGRAAYRLIYQSLASQ